MASRLQPCGTNAAYGRHLRAGDDPCDPCKQAHREYVQRWQTTSGRELAPCGTPAAARRHYRRGEPVDQACLAAARTDKAQRTGSDPWDTAHGGGTYDPRPVRNGIPVRLYTYRGTGYDQYEQEAAS